jgi:hypothetical protein
LRIVSLENNTISNGYKSGNVLRAVVSKKTDSGYVLILNGKEVLAQSQLNFTPGELITLRIVDVSQKRLLLKLVHSEKPNLNTSQSSDIIYKFAEFPYAQICFMIALKLNLPITKERISAIHEFLEEFMKQNDKSTNKSGIKQNFLQENAQEIKDFKLYILLKMLNVLHKKTNDNTNIVFLFSPYQPFYDKVYAKFARSNGNKDSEAQLSLSFIVDTVNLGSVLVEILQYKNNTSVTMVFEKSETLEVIKSSISKLRETTSSLISSINLKVGSISRNDFLFKEHEQHSILPGIDVRI